MVDGALQGLHGTIFAYGATGSGKTFAMLGSHDDPGIIPQAIAYIDKVEKEVRGNKGLQGTA